MHLDTAEVPKIDVNTPTMEYDREYIDYKTAGKPKKLLKSLKYLTFYGKWNTSSFKLKACLKLCLWHLEWHGRKNI